MYENMTQLGENICKYRKEQRYTRKGLAKLIGCSQSHIYALENGITKTTSYSLLKELGQVFGVKIDELMGDL